MRSTESFWTLGDLTGRSEMRTARLLVLMTLVMMVASLPIATSAYASGGDIAEEWAYYLWYWWEDW